MTFFTAGAIVGSAALGFLGSRNASKAQRNAANKASELSWRQYQQNRADLAPWRTGGEAANRRLMEYLGLVDPSRSGAMPTREQFTTTTAGTPGGWSFGGSTQGRGGPNSTWMPETAGTSTFDQAGYDAAMSAYNSQPTSTPEGYGSLLDPFTGEDLENEPGYQFGLQQGEQGINRAAAGRGSYDSGATLKALTRFNQDYAGTKYGAAYNRDMGNKNSIYGMLSGVSGTGANAAGQTAGLGANAANMQGQYATNAGDATAAGYIGGANAINNGVGSYLGYKNDQDILSYLRQPISSTAGNYYQYK